MWKTCLISVIFAILTCIVVIYLTNFQLTTITLELEKTKWYTNNKIANQREMEFIKRSKLLKAVCHGHNLSNARRMSEATLDRNILLNLEHQVNSIVIACNSL